MPRQTRTAEFPLPERDPVQARPPISGWAVAATLGTLFLLLYLLRNVLLPFLLAAALAYIAQPALYVLRSRIHLPRIVAVVLIFLVYLVLIGSLLYWIGSQATGQVQTLFSGVPKLIHEFLIQVVGVDQFEILGEKTNAEQLTQQVVGHMGQGLGPDQAIQAAEIGAGMVMGFFLTLVLLFYFLLDGQRLLDGTIWLLPPPRRNLIRALLARIDPVLGRYIRGVFLIVAITTILSWIGIAVVLRIPNGLLLALTTGVFEMVPVIGPLAAAVLVGVVAIQQGGIWLVLGFVAYYIILRLLIDQVIGPVILGRAATLHPVVIILAFLVGGVLYGVFGVLLSVPVAAAVKIVLREYYEERRTLEAESGRLAN